MGQYIIHGGKKLVGEIEVDASKNASLPIIAATLLSNDKIVLKNLPNLSDIEKMLNIIRSLGGAVVKENRNVIIDTSGINSFDMALPVVGEIRSSIFMLGPMLARTRKAIIARPGGCNIGNRPIDLHIKGLERLGVKIKDNGKLLFCDATALVGGVVHLDCPSVGATENIMMVGCLNKGKSVVITNAAREPEIVDLANFINKMGGKISGAGTSVITIEGVEKLNGTIYEPVCDRIVAGTYMIATAMTGGKVYIKNCKEEFVFSLILKLRNSGCKINIKNDIICVENFKRVISCPIINTQPYPGFPTDLQAPMLALQSISNGISVITENLFDDRFKHVPELVKMGAKINVQNRMAVIRGVEKLIGTEVSATDLRGGAALVLAGLVAEGETILNNIHYIERGYENLDYKLSSLGAWLERK